MVMILGIVVILIMTVLAYRAADKSGKPGMVWAICTVGVGILVQFVAPFLVLKLIVASLLAPGGPGLGPNAAEKLNSYANVAGLAGVALSLVAMFIVTKLASRRG